MAVTILPTRLPRLFLPTRENASAAKRSPRQMFFEPLEDRRLLAEYFVGGDADAGHCYRDAAPLPDSAFIHIARWNNNGPDPNPWPDSVTVSYHLLGDAAPGVDYSAMDGTAVIPAGTNVVDIEFHALEGQYHGPNDRTLLIGVEITSAESSDPNTTYGFDSLPSGGPFNGSNWPDGWPLGTVDQLGTPGEPEPAPTLPGGPTCSKVSKTGVLGFFPSVGVSNSGGDPGWSAHPVRYFDGAAYISSTDLVSDADGMAWGVTREWTNAPGFDGVSTFGTGVAVDERPYLIQAGSTENPDDSIAVIANGHAAFYFNLSGSVYQAEGFIQDKLTHDTDNHQFVLADPGGAVLRFNDFSSSIFFDHDRGQLNDYTDPGGNVVTLAYDANNGLLATVTRQAAGSSPTIFEQLAYHYVTSGENQGLVASIDLQRKVGPTGTYSVFRTVAYDYYDDGDPHGDSFEIKKATIKDAIGNVIDTMYYRYYTQADLDNGASGYVGGLKYVFGAASYARLTAAQGTNLDSISDTSAAPFADNYFEYDSQQRATKEIAQGAGCSTCNAGLGSFDYAYTTSTNADGYNSWKVKTVETLPDNDPVAGIVSENIVYTNYQGELMLKVYHHSDSVSGDQKWMTYYEYDDDGRVITTAQPSAVSGYDDTYADLVNFVSNNAEYLNDSTGLITTSSYYIDTTATSTTPGSAAGYLANIAIQQGESGTSIPQQTTTYYSQTAGSTTIFMPATQAMYVNTNGTGTLTTNHGYTFFTGTLAAQSIATTDAAGGVTTTFYDVYGRPIWIKDQDGFINYTEYDPATGAISKRIVDVDTTQASTFANKPSGWTTPTSGGLHLTTTYELDALGRPTKTTDANTNVTYAVFNDASHEIRVYPGWNTGTNTPTGPTILVREDRDHGDGYAETLSMSATPAVSGGRPTGGESISNLQSLSRTYFNDAGQAIRTDEYFDLTGLTYSSSAHIGTLNTNYYETDIGYDDRGRQNRLERGDGEILRTVYDGLGRPISKWLGNNDTPASGWWSPSNPADMVKQTTYAYDNGGVGDSNVTSTADGMNRTTTLDYDFRNRQISTTLPDPDAGGPLQAPVYLTGYDNVDRVISTTDPLQNETTYDYDDANRMLTITQPDPDEGGLLTNPITVQAYNARGLMASLTDPDNNATAWTYDGARRMKTDTNQLTKTRTYSYDGVGVLTERIDRLGRKIDYVYDKADRPTDEKWYDGATLVRTISYTYDAAGHLDQATDPAATYGYDYDALGRVSYESQSYAGFSPLIEYTSVLNGAGNLTTLTATIAGTPDFQNTYSYDALARLSHVIQQDITGGNAVADKRADFAYNAANQFDTISRYAGTTTSELAVNTFYKYDDAGRLTALIHSTDATAPASGWGTNPLAGYQFTYDDNSRIHTNTSYLDGLTTYAYDDTNQLTSADHTGQTDESYSYDENGNRAMTGYSTTTNNRLSSDGTYNYSYDDEGNRLTKTTIATDAKEEYTWDWRNRLTGVTFKDAGGTVIKTVTLAYDYLNQWIARSVDDDGPGPDTAVDTFFSHEAGQVALQFDGSAASDLSHRYFWNPAVVDQLLADESVTSLATPGPVQYPLGDQLGTLRDLASHNSTTHATSIDNHRRYDDYGNLVSESNAAIDQLFGYTGRALDDSTGLQNNLNRWYDPKTGTWTSQDPIGFAGDPTNPYRYVGNSPVDQADPSGLHCYGCTSPYGKPPPPQEWNTGKYGAESACYAPGKYGKPPERPGSPGPGEDYLSLMVDCLRGKGVPVVIVGGTLVAGARVRKSMSILGQDPYTSILTKACQWTGQTRWIKWAQWGGWLARRPFILIEGAIDWAVLIKCDLAVEEYLKHGKP